MRQSTGTALNGLIYPDERASVIAAVAKTDPEQRSRLSKPERRLLMSVAMRVIPARHTKHRIDDELANRVLAARRFFATALTGAEQSQIEFFDPERYVRGLAIRENLLFGVVKSANRQSATRLESTLLELIDEYGLADIVMRAGFEYSVGLGGNRLTPEQRQKLELARMLLRNPDLAVLHGATSHVNEQSESVIVSALVTARRGRSLIWILDRPSLARHFGSVMVFDRGRLVEQGGYVDFERAGSPLRALHVNNLGA